MKITEYSAIGVPVLAVNVKRRISVRDVLFYMLLSATLFFLLGAAYGMSRELDMPADNCVVRDSGLVME